MATTKNFGLAGVAADVQFGKKGGALRYTTTADAASGTGPAFQVRNAAGDGFLRIQASMPQVPDDVATKLYVDNAVQGLDLKQSVRVASAKDVNHLLNGSTPLTIDGVVVADGDRVLLKDQTDKTQNGIYVVGFNGNQSEYVLTRADDANNVDVISNPVAEVTNGMFTFVEEGTNNIGTGWVLSAPVGVADLGNDELVFSQFSSAGVTTPGFGLEKQGVVFNVMVDNATTYIDSTNHVAVKSSASTGQTLLSAGSGSAAWGALNLALTGTAVTGSLRPANGGTGLSSYQVNDLIIGGAGNTLTQLAVGANNTYLGVDGSGNLVYQNISDLRDANGNLLIQGLGTASAVNYATVSNSLGTDAIGFGVDGAATDLDMLLSPKGEGHVVAPTGYGAAFVTNRATISDDAFAPKAFVDQRVDSIDTTRIQNAATTTYFATDLNGFTDHAMVGSNGKVIGEFIGATDSGVAASGEHFVFTHVTDELQLKAVNTSGVGDVNLRLLPQAQGQVFIGNTGSGIIQGEGGYQLTIKGGDSTAQFDAGGTIIRGGDALSGDLNGGTVVIRGGVNSGAGERGTVQIQDDRQVVIVDFVSPITPAGNWMEIENAAADVDPQISGVKIRAAAASANGDVSIILDPKGNGLVRVADSTTYLAQLQTTGQADALVTKGYISQVLGGVAKEAGIGLTDAAGTFNVNIGASTIKVDGSDNLIVNSSATQNQVMLSSGVFGGEATWGALPLASNNAVTGILGVGNGGTGLNSYLAGDLLVGGASNTLTKLTKGPNNSALQVNSSGTLQYGYITQLRDASGLLVANTFGTASAVNNLSFRNAALTGAPEIASEGTDTNVSIILNPKGTGLVIAKNGYTANIGSNRETIITKGYVDDALQFNTDPLMRRQAISSGWTSVMNIALPTPNVAGRQVYMTRVTMNVISPVTGGNTALARVVAGANELMNVDENDVAETGVYVADLPFGFTSSNTQVTVEFYEEDGSTPAIPTSGSVIITAEYKIL